MIFYRFPDSPFISILSFIAAIGLNLYAWYQYITGEMTIGFPLTLSILFVVFITANLLWILAGKLVEKEIGQQ